MCIIMSKYSIPTQLQSFENICCGQLDDSSCKQGFHYPFCCDRQVTVSQNRHHILFFFFFFFKKKKKIHDLIHKLDHRCFYHEHCTLTLPSTATRGNIAAYLNADSGGGSLGMVSFSPRIPGFSVPASTSSETTLASSKSDQPTRCKVSERKHC